MTSKKKSIWRKKSSEAFNTEVGYQMWPFVWMMTVTFHIVCRCLTGWSKESPRGERIPNYQATAFHLPIQTSFDTGADSSVVCDLKRRYGIPHADHFKSPYLMTTKGIDRAYFLVSHIIKLNIHASHQLPVIRSEPKTKYRTDKSRTNEPRVPVMSDCPARSPGCCHLR
jgi:hypothetical protein